MLFNSSTFLVFILIFMLLYFNVKNHIKIWLALVASYVFYGFWDWRFLLLIVASTLTDYYVGLRMGATDDAKLRKRLLWISLSVNLGFLAFFKYFNFFIGSFSALMQSLGMQANDLSLNIILPVGISFYTFQTLSYTLDIYWRRLTPETNLRNFATFVAFFPQLVAGPIIRASHFLPELRRPHRFNWIEFLPGMGQVFVGYFKKVVVADSLAVLADRIFDAPEAYSPAMLTLGIVFYAFQIYCDFSGYSDIAIGLARMLGYRFPANFNVPYVSKSFSEFWLRWHISLSSWLRDYLYIPLGGNRKGVTKTYRNLMVTMLLGGLWHGANWTFVFWGLLHGLYLVAQRLLTWVGQRMMWLRLIPKPIRNAVSVVVVFAFTCLAWVFFRSPDFGTAMTILQGVFDVEAMGTTAIRHLFWILKGVTVILMLVIGEVIYNQISVRHMVARYPIFTMIVYAALILSIILLGTFNENQFIYFQF